MSSPAARHLPPSPFIRSALAYVPGAVFVAFAVPALIEAGPKEWLAAAAFLSLMRSTGWLALATIVGVAVCRAACAA